MEYNRSSTDIFKEDAFTNNTFSLKDTERTLRKTLENSFNYLKKLQKSYINIKKFVKSEDDFYIDDDGNLCLSLDKDFIHNGSRKAYRTSEFYNKYIDIQTIQNNRDIFSYTPIVFIDGKSVFNYEVKSSLDGNTEIRFKHVKLLKTYLSKLHIIEVIFLWNTAYYSFTTNKYALDEFNWKVPSFKTGIKYDNTSNAFIFIQPKGKDEASNIFYTTINEDNSINIDYADINLYGIITSTREVTIHCLVIDDLHLVPVNKPIKKRIDNGRLSSTFILPEETSNIDATMPIPTDNIILLKINKLTRETVYDSNKEIIHHYPNIYEVISDDLSEDYEYKVFYFYKDIKKLLNYKNHFKFIHRYFMHKLGTDNIEEAICKLLYTDIGNDNLQNYFFSIFDYEDADYIYNHGDFFNTLSPYDFDYKVNKLKEFINYDPFVLEDYGKRVSTPNEKYFLRTKNIDLSTRIRNNTNNEVEKDIDKYEFSEPHYVFTFRNESTDFLNFRIFIDGLLCTDLYRIQLPELEYIYIPTRYITDDSYIEIENFGSFSFTKTYTFTSLDDYIEINIPKSDKGPVPTLYDLFMTDSRHKRINRRKFSMYLVVEPNLFDVSDDKFSPDKFLEDYIDMTNNKMFIDEETGELCILINDPFENEEENSIILDTERFVSGQELIGRLPIKYTFLGKLRIYCTYTEYLNMPITFDINKFCSIHKEIATGDSMPTFRITKGRAWKEDTSYVRLFVNGRLTPITVDMMHVNYTDTYGIVKSFMKEGEEVVVDVTPYSYTEELSMKKIPDDFIVSFDGKLSKPFSFDYYDLYLNGRKLNEMSVQVLTADKIKLFNVKSQLNFSIFRKDRDVEYYGFKTKITMPIDDILNSDKFPLEDKNNIIDDIIKTYHPDDEIVDGENTEEDITDNITIIPELAYEMQKFDIHVVRPGGRIKPNSTFVSRETVEDEYPKLYETFTNKYNRYVFKPNKMPHARAILKLK